ncbi:complex I assembly factor TIMMDC1, mitochondrial isoform X1 [Scyliorhinus canicula]|uniref:complex I assembly factor TIMMDC1, mitochondrial isoform X1 n=2 Tax=Scyliorhinus canicula TaxID=7830 RepID=UPI0018F2C8F3|nr:complex I assembly factor TIMMDC1, mitochondrial isoform X1 [Scyliorhinus canicula]
MNTEPRSPRPGSKAIRKFSGTLQARMKDEGRGMVETNASDCKLARTTWNCQAVRFLQIYQNCSLREMFHFPRVHAAEDVGRQPENLPKYVGSPQAPESGWDRIRELFDRDELKRYPEEITNIWKSVIVAACVGMLYGGIPAAKHAKIRYIEQSQAEVYKNRLEAVRSAQDAAVRGFVRYGWRWSWRVTAFVAIFNTVSTGLSVYHDRNLLRHYSAAGAITGGVFRMNLGVGGFLAGTAIGALMGVPAGALILAMQKVGGETVRERRRRERREMFELKLEEWKARLHVTEGLVDEIAGKDSVESDLVKLEELLNQPRNSELTVGEKI